MLTKVRALIDNHHMFQQGDKVLAACSGGPDSLALVHILHELSLEYNIQVFVAHVDHMFRGEESAEDARFVASFCREYGLPLFQTAINVPAFIKQSRMSSEEAARILRYRYLYEVAQEIGGAKIATGHHQDDQAETVLLHLLRGAGSAGIRGMQPVNGEVVRPLLRISRQEINQYCDFHHLSPRFDSSNSNTQYLRNRIRLELLPLLEKNYNPAVKESLCRTAQLIGEERDFVHSAARKLYHKAVSSKHQRTWIVAKYVREEHLALQREFFRVVIEKKQGHTTGITFAHVEALISMLVNGRVGTFLQLPGGLRAQKEYEGLYLDIGEQVATPVQGIEPPGYPLLVPGTTTLPALKLDITAELKGDWQKEQDRYTAVFDWEKVQQPLLVRTRLYGDRFRPYGLSGSKKLKEFFIDNKVPLAVRDSIPLICDGTGILWIGGYRQSAQAAITPRTKVFLKLQIKKQEEPL